MMLTKSLNMNIQAEKLDSKSQYRYRKQKRIPVFPQRLYDMLEHAEERGYSHIFSWMPDGKSFKVHLSGARCTTSEGVIVKVLKSNNFQQTKFRSFLRQLNQYGFERTQRGKGEFRHEFFVRGRRDLLEGKSIDDFQQPQDWRSNENEDDGEEHKQIRSFHQLLRLSSTDNTSLFLESDRTNYWKPSSANLLAKGGVLQETAWQSYAKSLVVPTSLTKLRQDKPANEKFHESSRFILPSSLTNQDHRCSIKPSTEWNDDDTIPTIDSNDDYFDDFVQSQFDTKFLREEVEYRSPCHIVS